jgi:type VI secretion system secreted protein VgrG
MQEEEAVHMVINGSSNARSMCTGYKFTLTEHYRDDMNTSYLLTDIEHIGNTTAYGNAKGGQQDHYSNSFRCIPASVPFRPLRVTPRPSINGPQPAVVVGKSGEEIWTDQYGRVKVQFFWDRLGKKDENSSCWIRVAQFWAGKTWGAMFLPRMGQEVIVEFMEGDPDQPLVTGRVYNADQTVPYTLPGDQTKSTIKTRSSKGGGSDNFNEIRFEDLMGSEEVFIHAEKDMNREVENNDSLKVGNNQTIQIQQDRTETVTQGNEKVTIQQGTRTHTVYGDESLTVQSGNRSVEVQQGNDTHTVDMGNRSATISMGNDSLTVSMGNHSINVSLGTSSITAMQSITLTCGPSSITISPSGVSISAPTVSISGDATVSVTGGAEVSVTGGMVMINS